MWVVTEVPVKIEKNGQWVVSKIDILQDAMKLQEPLNRQIPYKSIVDLVEKKNILLVTLKGEPGEVIRIASVEKVLQALKRVIIMSCSAYRLTAYFMSPAVRGGVMVTNAQWEKGAISVLKSGIWFVSQNKQVSVPLREVAGIELTKREVQNKQVDVVKIDHLEHSEVVTSFVLCPLSTLNVLFNFLKDTTKDMDMAGNELDALGAQVGMLIYSGMDSHAIENMLNVSHKDLDGIYDKLIQLGLAEVMFIRKEVQLTPKGVRYISEAVKPPQ
jgi:helix-turn-helix protein